MIFDWVYLAVLVTVFGVSITIAYARGYSHGHDVGYAEAALAIARQLDERRRRN